MTAASYPLAASGHFNRQLNKLSSVEQENVITALKSFLASLKRPALSKGLGFKKINGDKYELRVNNRLRILMVLDQVTFVCHIVGNHDSIQRYLKDYRGK